MRPDINQGACFWGRYKGREVAVALRIGKRQDYLFELG
jgi:hypothetical protein